MVAQSDWLPMTMATGGALSNHAINLWILRMARGMPQSAALHDPGGGSAVRR